MPASSSCLCIHGGGSCGALQSGLRILDSRPATHIFALPFACYGVDYPPTMHAHAHAHTRHTLQTGHSFTPLADSTRMVTLRHLPRTFTLCGDTQTVTCDGGATLAELAQFLRGSGFALKNAPSLPHITGQRLHAPFASQQCVCVHVRMHVHAVRCVHVSTCTRGLELMCASRLTFACSRSACCHAGLLSACRDSFSGGCCVHGHTW